MDLPDLTTPTPSYSPSDAPPTTPILGFLAYANAAGLKCHFPASPTGPPPPPDPPASSFKECLKNHAACIGGHALDGCCQFLPTPSFNPNSDPISLICAACGCHRNFHRPDNAPAPALLPLPFHPFLSPSSPPTPAAASASPLRPTPDPAPASPKKRKQRSKSKKKKKAASPVASPVAEEESSGKRFRTKFSKEQKERMYQFSEKVGWKLQNADKEAVEDFCEEVGVEKEVLRIWMNNNKHTFGRVRKRSLVHAGAGDGSAPPPRRGGGGRGRAERPRLGSGNGGSPAASSG